MISVMGYAIQGQGHYSRWNRSGVWQPVFGVLAHDADNEFVLIDLTIIRSHWQMPELHRTGVLFAVFAPRPGSKNRDDARLADTLPGQT